MRALGLDHLSLFDLTPAELVRVAADAGCRSVGLFLEPVPFDGAARFDMSPSGAAFRDTLSVLAATGLKVVALDPFLLLPETDFARLERNLEIGARLGARAANVVVLDSDPARREDNLARLFQRAEAHGLALWIEAYTLSEIRTNTAALALADCVSAKIGLTVDSLHVRRAGDRWSDIATLPAARIAYVQISDGPAAPPDDLAYEAVYERGLPGDGELDLPALIALILEGVPISIEAPSQRLKAEGLTPLQRVQRLTTGSQRLFPAPS
jgi:sugar phosphate isomerase/epimerase